jgi:hypothetical protein
VSELTLFLHWQFQLSVLLSWLSILDHPFILSATHSAVLETQEILRSWKLSLGVWLCGEQLVLDSEQNGSMPPLPSHHHVRVSPIQGSSPYFAQSLSATSPIEHTLKRCFGCSRHSRYESHRRLRQVQFTSKPLDNRLCRLRFLSAVQFVMGVAALKPASNDRRVPTQADIV